MSSLFPNMLVILLAALACLFTLGVSASGQNATKPSRGGKIYRVPANEAETKLQILRTCDSIEVVLRVSAKALMPGSLRYGFTDKNVTVTNVIDAEKDEVRLVFTSEKPSVGVFNYSYDTNTSQGGGYIPGAGQQMIKFVPDTECVKTWKQKGAPQSHNGVDNDLTDVQVEPFDDPAPGDQWFCQVYGLSEEQKIPQQPTLVAPNGTVDAKTNTVTFARAPFSKQANDDWNAGGEPAFWLAVWKKAGGGRYTRSITSAP